MIGLAAPQNQCRRHTGEYHDERGKAGVQEEHVGGRREDEQAIHGDAVEHEPGAAQERPPHSEPGPYQHGALHRPRDRDPVPLEADRDRECHEREREAREQHSGHRLLARASRNRLGHGEVQRGESDHGERERPAVAGPQQHVERARIVGCVHEHRPHLLGE